MLEIYFGDAIAALPVLESVALYLVEIIGIAYSSLCPLFLCGLFLLENPAIVEIINN
jgi:hypothetical protein